ncbi:MAG: acyl-CoA synthetase [Betaproteobacteria bacterium RIFCSPLOWO2_12_FULL_62_13]|nr:MAG: acyl-CoA synthetase [Betaproteobacteria bacterium RIFCSPLOWO2_12_FULL_62_13]
MAKLRDLAKVCKSKNAGPFEVTIDIMFETREIYDKVVRSGVLNEALFAKLYGVDAKDILFTPYPAALALKGTIPRRVSSGDVGDTDVYGAQQHAPMLDVEIPM